MAAANIESGSSFTQDLWNNGQWSFAAGTYPWVGVVGGPLTGGGVPAGNADEKKECVDSL